MHPSCNEHRWVLKEANTLYVSKGIADTWSNQMTPFLAVVNWSLELWFVSLASNRTSTFVQFDTSDAEDLRTQSHVFKYVEMLDIYRIFTEFWKNVQMVLT